MKNRGTNLLARLLIIAAACSCEEEKIQWAYPTVSTMAVSDISPDGATFSGSFESRFLEQAIDHGFVWGDDEKPSVARDAFIQLGIPSTSEFTTEVRSLLVSHKTYHVRAYVQMSKKVIYGPAVTFLSFGSEGPKIENFNPKEGKPKDVIVIDGKNFATRLSDNIVLFETPGATYKALIRTGNTTRLEVEVPAFFIRSSKISVSIAGNVNVHPATFTLNGIPEITSIAPSVAHVCDTLTINGMDLLAKSTPQIWLGGESFVSFFRSNTTIKGVLQIALASAAADVELHYPNFPSIVRGVVNFAKPQVSSVDASTVNANGLIQISGANFPKCALRVTSNKQTITTTVESVTDQKISVRASGSSCDPFTFYLYAGTTPVLFFASAPILRTPGVATGISPSTGTYNDIITITGTNLGPATYLLGGASTVPENQPASQLTIRVPGGAVSDDEEGNTTLKVTGCNNSSIVFPFVLKKPEILDFNPKVVTAGDQWITITGKNMAIVREIYLHRGNPDNGIKVEQFAYDTDASTKFTISGINFGSDWHDPFFIGVRAFGMVANSAATLEVDFRPKILSVSPSFADEPGDAFTITGNYFLPQGNIITLEDGTNSYLIERIHSESTSRIVFGINNVMPMGYHGALSIKLEVNGTVAVGNAITVDLRPAFYSMTEEVTDPSEEIIIYGRNFQDSDNIVTLENGSEIYEVITFISKSSNIIRFSIGNLLPAGYVGTLYVKVNVNGIVATSSTPMSFTLP